MSDSIDPDRSTEIAQNLAEIKGRVLVGASVSSSNSVPQPTLVAVSKFKPGSEIKVCFDQGQLDFGENYVQELVDKASTLPKEIRWHFIGHLQSNKSKIIACIPNLYSLHTLSSTKTASLLQKALPADRETPLNVLLQVNTSGEDAKSGLSPLHSNTESPEKSELAVLALHVINECPGLRLQGLMTIGSLASSLAVAGEENPDFQRLKETRLMLSKVLDGVAKERWGTPEGHLALSMGMSSDFEEALKAGSDIVRVGTGIFGSRKTKEEIKSS